MRAFLRGGAAEAAIADGHGCGCGAYAVQGSTTSTSMYSKSRTLRVTNTESRERDMAAIRQSASWIGRPRAAAPEGDLCMVSGGGAVERQNPVAESHVEPPGQDGFQLIFPPAGRYDCDAVAQFGFADRRQKQLVRVPLRNPCRD